MDKIIFFAKDTTWCRTAALLTRKLFGKNAEIFFGKLGDPFPRRALQMEPEILVSFVSPWVIPEKMLKKTKKYAINFHPGPPEYPGIGCYNFALYDQVKSYGVTCHVMEKRVDRGRIITVKEFPMVKGETIESLKIKSMRALLDLYKIILTQYLVKGKSLPQSRLRWLRRPFLRKELNLLCEVKPTMSKQEIARRVKATHYPGYPGAYINIGGYKFEYTGQKESA